MYRPVIGFLRCIYWSNGKFPFTSIESLWIQPFFGLYYWGGEGGKVFVNGHDLRFLRDFHFTLILQLK